jgi:ADP-heptose:LPS heptosyltransferase
VKRSLINLIDVRSILFHTAEDRLGDALIKLPAIMALKMQRPDLRLVWTTGREPSVFRHGLAPLVAGLIDEIHEISGLGSSWSQVFRCTWHQSYDCIIASEQTLRATLALKRLSHKIFVAPMANFILSDLRTTANFSQLSVYRQTQTLFELAIGEPLKLPSMLTLPSYYVELAAQLLPAGPAYIGFAPGAGGKEKCWPLNNYLEIARRQKSRHRVAVFFLGPDEQAWRKEIALAIPDAIFPEYSASGERLDGPLLTIALAQRLRASVANDSGAGHLLAAGGQPLISLFGRTNPRKFEPPFGSRHVLQSSNFGSTSVAGIPLEHVAQLLENVCG